MTLRNKIKRLIKQNLSALAHNYNFTIFLGFGRFAENIYNGNLSLKAAKIKQRNMEYMIKRSENYNPKSKKYKTQFYKGRKMILIAFENDVFPLPKQYPSGMDDWEEDAIDSSQFLAKKPDTLLPSFQH